MWPVFSVRTLALGAALLVAHVVPAIGHGLLKEPKSRNLVASEAGNEDCPHCLQGGGPDNVKSRASSVWPTKDAPGSHGLCGDPGQGLPNPASPAEQKYMVPTASQKVYQEGETVEFTVELTAHHRGHYEFRICSDGLDGREADFSEASGQQCLDKHVLLRADPDPSCQPDDSNPDCQPIDADHPGRWYVPPAGTASYMANPNQGDPDWDDSTGSVAVRAANDVHKMRYKLPAGLRCSRCTLQWYYSTGNTCWYDGAYKTYFTQMKEDGWNAAAWAPWAVENWATCANTCCNSNKFGEEFWNCADITIEGTGGAPAPQPTPSPTIPMAQPTPSPTQATPPPTQVTPAPTLPTPVPTRSGTQPDECQAPWAKCFGSGWQGPSCCTAGHICEKQDEWYSQCVPEGGSGGTAPSPATPEPTSMQQPSPTPAPGPGPQPTTCQAAWGKCGGLGWQGPFCCTDGYECKSQDEWYSQCVTKPASMVEAPRKNQKKARAHSFLGQDHIMFQRVMHMAVKKGAPHQKIEPSNEVEGVGGIDDASSDLDLRHEL